MPLIFSINNVKNISHFKTLFFFYYNEFKRLLVVVKQQQEKSLLLDVHNAKRLISSF
jgi:hypothetical protein